MSEPDLEPLAKRLERERPVPSPGFRAALRRRLETLDPDPGRPANLGFRVAALAGAGGLLLALAAIGLAGVGPLAR